MAPIDSPFSTYDDTTPQKRVITDVISLIDPSDAPMVEALGGLDGSEGKFRFVNGDSTKVEWLEDTLAPLAGTLSTSCTSNTTAISVVDASVFQEGHILLIGSEQVWVSSVAIATNLLTITRAFQGTAATHQSNSDITTIGMARLEGDDSDDIAFTDRTVGSNNTQIYHQEIKVNRSQNQIAQYGIAEEFDYQAMKAVPNLIRLIERDAFYSTASAAGSKTTARAMGGFGAFVSDNKVDGSSITQAKVENAVKAAYEDGGSGPWLAFCSPSNLQSIKNIYDSSNFLRIDRSESTMGMVIERVLTPFGNIDLVLDRWAKDSEIYLIDPKHAGYRTFYPFTQEPLAKDGDYQKGEVVGEFTLCVRQDKAHAVLTNVS